MLLLYFILDMVPDDLTADYGMKMMMAFQSALTDNENKEEENHAVDSSHKVTQTIKNERTATKHAKHEFMETII